MNNSNTVNQVDHGVSFYTDNSSFLISFGETMIIVPKSNPRKGFNQAHINSVDISPDGKSAKVDFTMQDGRYGSISVYESVPYKVNGVTVYKGTTSGNVLNADGSISFSVSTELSMIHIVP